MATRHPTERALFWLIGALMLSVPVGTIVSGLYPVTSRRIWVTTMEAIRVGGLWLIDVLPLGHLILIVPALFVLGAVLTVVNWFRGLVA